MIDCEEEVYTRLADILRETYDDGIYVTGEYVRAPSSFPHVSIVMMDNPSLKQWQDNRLEDVMVEPVFEINVYSNKRGAKKTECKAIANTIDNALTKMNFRRVAYTPVPNLENATIYRIVMRYRGMTDGTYFYRR